MTDNKYYIPRNIKTPNFGDINIKTNSYVCAINIDKFKVMLMYKSNAQSTIESTKIMLFE